MKDNKIFIAKAPVQLYFKPLLPQKTELIRFGFLSLLASLTEVFCKAETSVMPFHYTDILSFNVN